jgi:hypothetical protein
MVEQTEHLQKEKAKANHRSASERRETLKKQR